jgi:hypothetical protein
LCAGDDAHAATVQRFLVGERMNLMRMIELLPFAGRA